MSYRTYINDVQIFGNNETYPEWLEFIKSQDIEINEEGHYKGEIKDFMAAMVVVESIVMRLEKERRERRNEIEENLAKRTNLTEEEKEQIRKHTYGIKSLFDWSNIYDKLENDCNKNDKFGTSLFMELKEIVDNGYAFMPLALYEACKDKLEQTNCFSTDGHFYCYKIKEGEKIIVSAN